MKYHITINCEQKFNDYTGDDEQKVLRRVQMVLKNIIENAFYEDGLPIGKLYDIDGMPVGETKFTEIEQA